MATTTTMSGAAFDQLPYDKTRRLELLSGEVLEMSSATPEHQLIVLFLSASLFAHLRREGMGGVLTASEFALGEDDRLAPDLAILFRERWGSFDKKKTPI